MLHCPRIGAAMEEPWGTSRNGTHQDVVPQQRLPFSDSSLASTVSCQYAVEKGIDATGLSLPALPLGAVLPGCADSAIRDHAACIRSSRLSSSAVGESRAGPQVFSMDADDSSCGSPFESKDSRIFADDQGHDTEHEEDMLRAEELEDYERIEEQFARFKANRRHVEQGVAELLSRLNTRIHIPSSLASSDIGSEVASEWDAMSEDFKSVLDSRVCSSTNTPSASPRGAEHADNSFPIALSERTVALVPPAVAPKIERCQKSVLDTHNAAGKALLTYPDIALNSPPSIEIADDRYAANCNIPAKARSHSRCPVGLGVTCVSRAPYDSFYAALACEKDVDESHRWKGWSLIATAEGRLFFYNRETETSQWDQPQELDNILGSWMEVPTEVNGERRTFWQNNVAQISLWKDPRRTTNIFQAARDGNLFFMQFYAQVDGNLDVIDPKGRSALHYSCAGGATQSAMFLVRRRANLDRRENSGATPLCFACRYGYASVAKVVLDASADANAADIWGNTALHEAASMGHADVLSILLEFGADTSLRTKDGETADETAARRGHANCWATLRRHDSSNANLLSVSRGSNLQTHHLGSTMAPPPDGGAWFSSISSPNIPWR